MTWTLFWIVYGVGFASMVGLFAYADAVSERPSSLFVMIVGGLLWPLGIPIILGGLIAEKTKNAK